jgi:limonene 1,2-monooxygenase
MESLRFGVFYAPFHPLDENPTLLLERDRELFEHFDRLGFDELWIGEHHSGGYEMIASPEVMLAAAAERTRRIRIGTGVKSLPFHNPFILTQTMVQLDHMTRGRAMFGVGPGALPMDAAQLGLDPSRTRALMGETLDVIMRLLAGERVTAETENFRLRDAKLHLDPYTKPHMEMAVTTIRSPAGAMAAGKHGLGLLSLGGASDLAVAAYAKNWQICAETARQHGKTVDRRNFRVAIQMHIAPTREQAREDVRFGLAGWARYAHDVLPARPIPPEVTDPVQFLIDNGGAVIGTPDDAVRLIERAQKGSGGFGVVMFMAHDWADWPATMRSYELFARYAMPRLNATLGSRQESYDLSRDRRDALVPKVQEGVADAERRLAEQKAPRPKRKEAAR